MIHLYAFACGLRELPPDADVECVQIGGMSAVVGRIADGDRCDSYDDFVRHGLVVEALVERADGVLPARFGERFTDIEALERAVSARSVELERRLRDMRGCVELAVRVGRTSRDVQRDGLDGASYLRARYRAAAEDAAAVSELHAALQLRARATAVSEQVAGSLLHDAGYLVGRHEIDEFARDVDAYASRHPEHTVVCTGPWAPSSFAGAA